MLGFRKKLRGPNLRPQLQQTILESSRPGFWEGPNGNAAKLATAAVKSASAASPLASAMATTPPPKQQKQRDIPPFLRKLYQYALASPYV